MNEFSWYSEASLVEEGHVFCAGSLAQCVRRWSRLSEKEQGAAFIKLHNPTDGHLKMERDLIAQYARRPDLGKV